MAAHHLSQGAEPPSTSIAKLPATLSNAEQEQVAALMTLTKNLSPVAMKELQRQIHERHNADSVLFLLPPELRDRIFEMAFLDGIAASEAGKCTSANTMVTIPRKIPKAPHETYKELKSLMRGPKSTDVCRQMRYECRSLLGLDKIETTGYTAASSGAAVLSPMALDEIIPDYYSFYCFVHKSRETAHQAASVALDGFGRGTVFFPSDLPIKPRFFSIRPRNMFPGEELGSFDRQVLPRNTPH